MKKVLLLSLLFSTDRVERLNYTQIDTYTRVEVLHDKESGIEIICVNKTGSDGYPVGISCVPTGRKW